MIYTSPLTTVSGSQVTVQNPRDFTRIVDHAVVYNPASEVVYLSFWRQTSEDRVGTYAIAPNQSITLPLGLHMGTDSCVMSANSNTDATGAPSGDLEVTLGWSA